MIIQGCKFRCLYKKQISYLLLQEGFTVIAIDLNVDDSEGDQDNGFDSLKDYASDNSNDTWWFIPRCLKHVYEHVAYD